MEASGMVAEPGSLFVWGGGLPGVPLIIDAADGAQVLGLGAPVAGSGVPVALLAEEGISWLSSSGEPEADAELDTAVASRLAQAAEAQAVACGRKHLLILSRDGSVFACGASEHGQCGLGHSRAVPLPLPLPTLRGKRITAISCGEAHSAALTDDGVLFTFGRGSEGQLGLGRSSRRGHTVGESTGDILAPRCVTALEHAPVAAVACGARFTLLALHSGEVMSMGEGQSGQLGIGRTCAYRDRPCLAARAGGDGAPFVSVAAGWAHALAVTASGALYAWGDNSRGQLGTGDTRPRVRPTRVADGGGGDSAAGAGSQSERDDAEGSGAVADEGGRRFEVVAAAAGRFHSAAVGADGVMFTWGASKHGQLGHGDAMRPSADVVAHAGAGGGAAGSAAKGDIGADGAMMARSTRPASPAAVVLAAQLASVDQPHIKPAWVGRGSGPGAAGGAIVSPFRRFHKRLTEADGGRLGVSASRGGAAGAAGSSVNLSALRRVPGLGAAVGGGGFGDGVPGAGTIRGSSLRGGTAVFEGTSASLTAVSHGRTPSLAAGGKVDPVLERAGRSADAAADAAEAAMRRWVRNGVGPTAAAAAAGGVGGGGGTVRGSETVQATMIGGAGTAGAAQAVDDDEALSGAPTAVVAAMACSGGRVPGARERATMRAARETASPADGEPGGSHASIAAALPAVPRPALPREAVPPVTAPARVALPELVGRVVTRVVCGAGVTAAFAPSVVAECLPPLGWSTGAKGWMAVAGPGLSAVAAAALRAVGETAAALPPRCREAGVGRALPGVLVRFTRPGVVPAAALEGDISQPSPEELEGFSPEADAQAAAAEPLVRFVRAFEALPGSELAQEASASALKAGRGARVGMAVDAVVCRAPDFPSACDVVVELLVRDRAAPDGGGGVKVPPDAWGWPGGSGEEEGEGEAAAAAAADAEAAAATEEAAGGAWTVVRGAAAASFCEQPEIKATSPEAAVLPAGATVTLRGDRLLGLLQKDPQAREAAARVVHEVEAAVAAKEEEEAAEATRQAEELYGGAGEGGGAYEGKDSDDDDGGAHADGDGFGHADVGASARRHERLRVTEAICSPDRPATTLVRWRILEPGADEADSVVTDPQPCWWSMGFEEAPAPDSGESAPEGASAGGASAVSVGVTSAQMLAGGGGGEESGAPVLGTFSAELITTLPALDPALLPAAASGVPLVVWPELSPNGTQWVAFRGAALDGVCPVLEGLGGPAVVPMCSGAGSDGEGACSLSVNGTGCVDTGGLLARLALVEASDEAAGAAEVTETTVQLTATREGLVSAGHSLFDALQTSGLVPIGGWATFEVDVSFDGGERFLALPEGSSTITVVDGLARPVVQPLLPADVPFWLAVDVDDSRAGDEAGDAAVTRPKWMGAPGVMESLVVTFHVTGVDGSPAYAAAALAMEDQVDEATGAAQLGVHVDLGAAVEDAGVATGDGEEWTAPLMLVAEVGLEGFASLGREASPVAPPAALFSAARCAVAAIGPKKLGPGAALDISVTGLASSRLAPDAVAAAQARVWVSTEEGQSPASGEGLVLEASAEPADGWAEAVGSAEGEGDGGRAAAVVHVNATLPSIEDGLKPGEQSFSVSFDKGFSWSQVARAKVAKK